LKNKKFSKAIGIVGGAGPVASAYLYTTIIELCQKEYGSNDYHDFPEIIIESYPFIRGDHKKIEHDISVCFTKLKHAGAELFSIASNSFHGCLPNISKIAFVNLVLESLEEASRLNISKPLILAAQPTIDMKLYEQTGLKCIYPEEEDQKHVQCMIREVAGGEVSKQQAEKLEKIIKGSRADGVILACTELPIIHRKFLLVKHLPIIDTVEVLAKKLLALA
jgi:aspartate/glutamate racemase